MNRVTYIGRLAQDGELSSSTNGTSFYRNTIAVSRKFKKEGEPDADFFRFKLFNKGADVFDKYTHKGSKVFLAGHNQIDEYTNKEGQKIRDTVLYVDEFEFLDAREQASQDNATTSQNASKDDFLSIPDGLIEELPFS